MTYWTADRRAEAIGLALAVGADKAHEATGIPRRTISSWLARERPAPELDALIVSSRDTVAARLWEAVTEGTEQVLAGLRDPKARLGDKAQALRIVAEQYALLTGGPTAINANVNVAVEVSPAAERSQRQLQRFRAELLAELAAGNIDHVETQLALVIEAEDAIAAVLAEGLTTDVDEAAAIAEARITEARYISDGLG